MLKVRTLFSGIGSPESALNNLKIPYELIDFCEVDKYAIKSYCEVHRVSADKNLGDISKVWGRNLPYADLLVWGFPCTDISVAGKQSGIIEGETRSGLYYEGFRILRETKPKYSIIENVKNLTGKKFKSEFEQMLKDIEELGYNNYWKVLNAKDYGIPQNRERVFIVSIRADVDTGKFEFPIGFDNGIRLKDILGNEVDEKYYISQDKTNKLLENLKDKRVMDKLPKGNELKILGTTQNSDAMGTNFRSWVYDIEGKCGALSATMYKEPTQICVPCITPDRLEKRQNGRRFKEDGDPSFTITTQDRHGILQVGNIVNTGNFNNPQRGHIYSQNGISPALNTAGGGGLEPKIFQNYRIRKLTPKECWRLMGFTNEEFERAAKVNSNSQLYKQAGNSIVTNVLAAIFKNLLQTEIATIYEENKSLS